MLWYTVAWFPETPRAANFHFSIMVCYLGLMGWPTTQTPRTEFVTVRFTEDEAAALDTLATSQGTNRSTAVREAVNRVLAAENRKARRAKQDERASSDTNISRAQQ